jgi:four helix bundle protein
MFDFEKLQVYQLTKVVSAEILRFCFTNRDIDNFLRDQLKRAIIGVQLNLSEGTGRITSADKKHFYAMARSSAFECVALLQILESLNELTSVQYEKWYKNFEEISKMMLGLIRST